MKSNLPFDLELPVIFVNPPTNQSSGLIEEVSRAGGLGVIDHPISGMADFRVSPEIPHGIRLPLKEIHSWKSLGGVKIIVVPYEDAEKICNLEMGELTDLTVPVVAEVGSRVEAAGAERAGASGLIARSHEGPGWVSPTTGFVLIQEILETCRLPVFLQGGVSLRTAAGAVAAGATGVVLDVHLLLTEGSSIPLSLKEFLRSLNMPATLALAECFGRPLRVYARVGTRIVRELKKIEDTAAPSDSAPYFSRLHTALRTFSSSLDADETLLPLSEDIVISRETTDQFTSADAIVKEYARRMSVPQGPWPFEEGSDLCQFHGTRFPLVQGPMAHVSDNADFLAHVSAAGALPFLALGNMPGSIAKEVIAEAFQKVNGNFGVGLIGLEVNRKSYEAHLDIMRENPPAFAILAAGSTDLARRTESLGIRCYLHCPAPGILVEGLKTGLRHFVFEGCESGGHIGTLGSLNLWSANLNVLQTAYEKGTDLKEIHVLFAGGVASQRGAAFVAGMVADLALNGLHVGLQMGTPYLTCKETVSTGAITSLYQKLTLESCQTVVLGRTVNTRARAADSPMATRLMQNEWERLRRGMPLTERKELYEKDNLGALRLASKGCCLDASTSTWDRPVFCDIAPEEQLDKGLFLMGQAICLLTRQNSMEDLHHELISEGRRLFETNCYSVEQREEMIESEVENQRVITVEHEKEPIAVIGIGLRFPGSNSPDTYWEQIISRRSWIVPVPEERWGNVDHYYDPDSSASDKSYTRIGGFIQDFEFDPLEYRIPPAVAKKMDRTQQFAVACTADAFLDAGLSPEKLKGRRVGVILGNSMGGENSDRYAERLGLPRAVDCLENVFSKLSLEPTTREALLTDFRLRFLADLPDITEDSLAGELANIISGRVANVFNLEGPNFTVDAACASSMAALMNAVAALRDGSIDYAVTGGVDAAMSPSSFVKFCKIGALSPDGSRPFDASANGFVMGEGAGIMILKRFSEALRDRDKIYGTIVEIGSSSDGRGKGITAPNAAGQDRAIKKCLQESGINPASIGLIEAHGTSTPVGDQTELTVLDAFFREARIPGGSIGIGSVKSQIGHLKAAAGAAGLIKALLSLHHRTLPPTINVQRPNPCIEWESSPLFLLTEARKWEPANSHPRRAGVSAFGFGGTNFHVVLQENVPNLRLISGKKGRTSQQEFAVPEWPLPASLNSNGDVWVLGGSDSAELGRKIESILNDLNPANAGEIAIKNRQHALHHDVRCGFAAKDADDAAKKLHLILEGMTDLSKSAFLAARGIYVVEGHRQRSSAGIAFLFPGQGSQYPYMLRDLAQRYPVVAETFVEADEILEGLGLDSITSLIFPNTGSLGKTSDHADPLKDTQSLQPMILTANTALFRLLSAMGVHPAAVAGHSLGEYAACVAAGVFSFRDALEAVSVRGREMARVSIADPGLMMSIPADARVVEEVLSQVDGYVVAANKNSPKQTVISGETAAVQSAGEFFSARGLEGIIIPVSAAFHSGVVAPAREPFMKTLEKLNVNPPVVPILSNVTGEFYPIGPAAPGRIRDLLGKQFAAPVEWVKSLRRLHSEGIRIFLECGPKRVLTNFTSDTLSGDVLAMPTNHPKKGGVIQLLETMAALIVEGVPVDLEAGERIPYYKQAVEIVERAPLRIVQDITQGPEPQTDHEKQHPVQLLDGLLDDEIRKIASQKEFNRFMELNGEPIRGLLKSSFKNFLEKVIPLQQTVRAVECAGMNFEPVVVSGISAGLPNDIRFPFDRGSLDDLIAGRNFIKMVPAEGRRRMLEKNVERLFKGPAGEAELEVVEDISGVIKLAGFFTGGDVMSDYDLDERLISSMDVTTKLAVAAGIEALRDAGIPLVQSNRLTTTGQELPDSWALPPSLRKETGVIFASAFPGMSSLVDEVTRETAARYGAGARKRLIDFYTGIVERIRDHSERDRITRWFAEEFEGLSPANDSALYTFNRSFLLKVLGMAHGQLAQLFKAQGPNTHVDAACASTTQALLLARDWIRSGQANRVVIVAADDVAGNALLPWIGSGFLAMGAATTNGNVSEAALPFDDRRHGLILGSAAVGLVMERSDLVAKRGMEAIASVEAGIVANSGFHGTRLDTDHISSVMETMIEKWETQSGLSRSALAKDMFFMSHETYSPKRGGSASAEIQALRTTFGDNARLIPIANTKGFTGHTMGVGVEDVVALRCLQKNVLPPIPNLKQPDPEFADMNLSRGGQSNVSYALRLAAGFGSQIVMAIYKALSRDENRISDLYAHRNWLRDVTGYSDPVVSVDHRTLRVTERSSQEVAQETNEAASTLAQKTNSLQIVSSETIVVPDEVRTVVLALLAEKTGYPPEMLDTGLDLEADLGIDTVKQAEFISEVRERFDIPRIEGLKIAEFPTIEHIIGFVISHSGRDVQPCQEDPTARAEVVASQAMDQNEENVRERILSLLSQKTGYPAEMLDTGLDLESDLGIDTLKQAEFISDIREAFNIPRIDGLKIADFPTIKDIVGFVVEKSLSRAKLEEFEPPETHIATPAPTQEDIRVFETRLVPLPGLGSMNAPEAGEVIVVGGTTDLSIEIANQIRSLGIEKVHRIEGLDQLPKKWSDRTGIVNLLPLSVTDDYVRKTFELYLKAASSLDEGPSFLVTAVSEDGAFGFQVPSETGYRAGAVSGATKAFAKEYPKSVVRVMDFHSELDASDRANIILRSLSESFPLETGVGPNSELYAVGLVPVLQDREMTAIKSGDVILVTGGGRGITAACLLALARECSLSFVILGRTSLSTRSEKLSLFTPDQWEEQKNRIVERLKRQGTSPTPVMVEKELALLRAEAEVFQHIKELKTLGSEVIYRSVDICNPEAVDSAIGKVAEVCARVDAVIHGAGIDASRSLKSKTLEQMEKVVEVKVEGMRHVLESLKRHQMIPRRIVGFGSVSGRFGNVAQVDYSAANDALAHLLRHAGLDPEIQASTIDWAPWAEVGMAVRGSVQRTLQEAGIDFIPLQNGAEILVRELVRPSSGGELVVAGRLGLFADDAFELPGKFYDTPGAYDGCTCAGQTYRLVNLLPGEYLRARIVLDPSHPLLDDHRIDRAAVLPGVGGLEIMRALASVLNPKAVGASFEDVKFNSPLKIFKDGPFEAGVEIARVPDSKSGLLSYQAQISSRPKDKDGKEFGSPRIHHYCRLVLGSEELRPEFTHGLWNESVFFPGIDIYSVFFHGPAFKFLDHVILEGQGQGIRFRYTDTDQRNTMFSDYIPGAIEAAFQAAAAYGIESKGIMSLPVGIDQVRVLCNNSFPFSGELTPVLETSRGVMEGRATLRFDGVITDYQGNSLIVLKGMTMVELDHAKPFPKKIFETISRMDDLLGNLDTDSSKILGDMFDDNEHQAQLALATPKRSKEWISGRVVLKRTVQRLLEESSNHTIPGKSIRIVQDDLGRPSAELAEHKGISISDVSLSHSNGVVMAAVTVPQAFEGFGIDIEKVEPRSEAWVGDYFTDEEIIAANKDTRRWLHLTRTWCLKEAALKAFGVGLRFDLRDIHVTAVDESGRARLEFRNGAASHFNSNRDKIIEARVEEKDDYVIARVMIRK